MPGRQSSLGQTDVMRRLNSDIKLAKRFPEINVIVSGHAHTGTPDAVKVNNTLIVSTNAYTTELGKLEISFDTKNKKIISHNNQLLTIFDDEVVEDKKMSEVVSYWQQEVDSIASEKISYSSSNLTRAYGRESNMGNLFADAMEDYDDAIDFAVVNSGALRQDITKGDVSFGDLISAFPFPNTLVSTKLTGSQIKEIFDHAAGLSNGILQVSKSFKYSFSPENRVINMWLNGKKILENQLYNVASSSFVTDGGDGYLVFKEGLETKDTGINIYEVVKEYLASKEIFSAQIEGRIIEEI
jgi:2',3'-cyclic-nucleotide 2'-phosphodiesterase (5'-nucleotidase family)